METGKKVNKKARERKMNKLVDEINERVQELRSLNYMVTDRYSTITVFDMLAKDPDADYHDEGGIGNPVRSIN